MPDPATARTARCYCGALSLTVTAAPVHHHACACTRCQRATGSVMGVNGWFAEDAVQITGTFTTWYPEGPDHPDIMTAFCAVCGSGGFSRTGPYFPGTLVIPMGSFADPDLPTAFGAPQHIHWWGNRADWIGTPDVPCHDSD